MVMREKRKMNTVSEIQNFLVGEKESKQAMSFRSDISVNSYLDGYSAARN